MSGFKDILLFVFIFILPWQLNHYFFATSSYIAGIRIDHLAYTLYLTDLIWLLLVASYWRSSIKPFIKKAGLPILLSSIWVSWMIAFSVFPLWTLYSYVRLLQVIFTGVLFSHIKREEVQLITWGFFFDNRGPTFFGAASSNEKRKYSGHMVLFG
ncbi:MAG: hypothetical protein UZ21_OP11001000813 [Microgenomates bacterium OLB22]|nr:MAG: hypothetical protein UZ21_OP11001000813 [Microgenomates bacterium OLB22]